MTSGFVLSFRLLISGFFPYSRVAVDVDESQWSSLPFILLAGSGRGGPV